MPMPKPRSGESKESFTSRFHSEMASEFPDPKQRHAVAMKQWAGKDLASELEAGTAEEMEHTDDPKTARRIAADHVRERPDYYTKLRAAGLMDEREHKMEDVKVFKALISRIIRSFEG